MKNTKSTKHALLTSVMALFLCVTMLLGTTFAWFTDTVTSGVNTIVAGNLDIEVQYSTNGTSWADLEGTRSLFSDNLWEPGHTEVVYLKIANAGTLALNYKVLVTPVSESGGVNVNGQSFKLSDYLVFGTTDPAETGTTYTREQARAAVGTTTGLNVNNLTKTGTMAGKTDTATDVKYLALVVYMPEDVGNDANYKTGTAAPTIELGIKVVATQKTAEQDSFDKNYDKDAVDAPFFTVGSYYDYFPQVSVSAPVAANNQDTVITAKGKLNSSDTTETTLAKVTVPPAAVASGTETLTVSVKPVEATNSNALNTIQTEKENGRETSNFDIKVEGIKDGNNENIEVEVFVGKGLSNVKVFHNGIQITGATYNPSTGIVAFTTKSFSDYTVSYDPAVAAIGDKTYGSLANAVAAAQDGETVKLLKDVTGDRISIKQSITIDGNGHTLTDNTRGGRAIWIDRSGVTLNLKNLTIDGANKCERGVQVNQLDSGWNNATINMDNCTLKNLTTYAINLNSNTTVDLNISNSSISGWAAINAYGTGNKITITDSTLEGINDKGFNADGWNNFATICLEGDTTGQSTLGSSDYNVTITNSTIIAKQTTGNKQAAIGFNANSKNSTVTLTNTAIIYGDEEKCYFAYDSGTGNKLVVDGETVHESPAMNCWYSNGDFNSDKTGGMYSVFEAPIQNEWLADGEGIILEKDVVLTGNLECKMTSGKFYLYFDEHTITGGQIILQQGVSVISDTAGKTAVFGGDGSIIEQQLEDGTYKYCLQSNNP